MRNNKNEHFQLTIDNIQQVTAFEVCDEAEKVTAEDIRHKGNNLVMMKDNTVLGCVNCYFVRWGGKKGNSRRCYKPDNFPMCKNHSREDGQDYIYAKVIK